MEYGIGSRVRVKLCAGDIVTAEILVIFTASVKKILVEFAKKFMRVDPSRSLKSCDQLKIGRESYEMRRDCLWSSHAS
jgi:hypothetical protein